MSQLSFFQKQLGYSKECDIWSWGVMLCELIGGFSPFMSQSIITTFENINSLNISWPKNISNQCRSLLQNIFVTDPNLRASIQEIKKHSFFRDIKWDDLDKSFLMKSELYKMLEEIKIQQKIE